VILVGLKRPNFQNAPIVELPNEANIVIVCKLDSTAVKFHE